MQQVVFSFLQIQVNILQLFTNIPTQVSLMLGKEIRRSDKTRDLAWLNSISLLLRNGLPLSTDWQLLVRQIELWRIYFDHCDTVIGGEGRGELHSTDCCLVILAQWTVLLAVSCLARLETTEGCSVHSIQPPSSRHQSPHTPPTQTILTHRSPPHRSPTLPPTTQSNYHPDRRSCSGCVLVLGGGRGI